ncbi:aldo/keto reductase [Vibrio breoganii]|uniref:aldo/keto reductase n=1 Tax=Vibrio breoganii TaxID=553239 RepID=UPI000C8422FA|nr:aldo/keto reductase [Vibrio breoganii]PMG89926.1 hypothetical protein BCU80_15705 [Vibrio breoganii]
MKSIVLIQSRFNSSRLPGKALFTIKGMPLVVLAALRASNTGKEVVVLTSDQKSDDEICITLDKFGIKYFRGSLNNVLDRFYMYINSFDDERVVFRLTADNVLPDGEFLDELESEFIISNSDIMSCNQEYSNLPYGVTAEVMRARSLKEAYANAVTDYDKEHVTPYIYRMNVASFFKSKKTIGYSNFRMTIDTIDDYFSVKSLFDGVDDVLNAPIQMLMDNFQSMKYRPYYEKPIKPMTLGTVQMGVDYGIANQSGKINSHESKDIIRRAITEGVEYIDTASSYGDSESVVGQALQGNWGDRVKIITKLPPFESEKFSNNEIRLATRAAVLNSCVNLQMSSFDTIMLHRAIHLSNDGIMNELSRMKSEGFFERIGVSVQNPKELENALNNNMVSIIQMPFNIIDCRWFDYVDKIKDVKSKRELIIHARSSLLQGLLISEEQLKWELAGLTNFEEIFSWLTKSYKKHTKKSIADLCINYVNSQDWIDSVVVGVDDVNHLYKNMQAISMPLLSQDSLDDIVESTPKVNLSSLDPSTWRKYV